MRAARCCLRSAVVLHSSDHHDMLRAIGRVMLDGALPNRGEALDAAVRGVEVAIAGLPPAVQGEVQQLFGLLEFPLTRRIVAGVGPWDRASDSEIADFLQRWRTSNAQLLAQRLRGAASTRDGGLVWQQRKPGRASAIPDRRTSHDRRSDRRTDLRAAGRSSTRSTLQAPTATSTRTSRSSARVREAARRRRFLRTPV